jgi:hypothetical protein
MKHLVFLFAVAFLVQPGSAQNGDRYQWTSQSDGEKISVKMNGEIEFARDYRSVTSMSRDAHIRIRREFGRRDWRLDIERDGQEIKYDYRKDGDRMSFASAREEIGDLLLSMVREGGIDAERRVGILLSDGGPERVLAEIRLIERSSGSSRYLTRLVAQADLSNAQLVEVAKLAVEEVASSGDRSRVLMATAPSFKGDRQTEGAWLRAAATVPSSGDRSRVLMRGMDEGLSMDGIAKIASSIPSSGDKTRVILRALDTNPSDDELVELLDAAGSISSSGDRSRVLLALSDRIQDSASVRSAFVANARGISSSGDKARVLLRVLQSDNVDAESLVDVLVVAKTISSSGDRTRVLISASKFVEGERAEAAYMDAVEGISSSGDRSRALRALLSGS